MEKLKGKIKKSVCISKSFYALMLPIMPALCLILNSAYYANNYADIFDAGLVNRVPLGKPINVSSL